MLLDELNAACLILQEKAKLKYQKINNEEITEPSLNKCIDKGSRKPIRRRPARCQCNCSNLIVLFFLYILNLRNAHGMYHLLAAVGFSNTIKKVADKKPVQSNRLV